MRKKFLPIQVGANNVVCALEIARKNVFHFHLKSTKQDIITPSLMIAIVLLVARVIPFALTACTKF